jgi:anti-sigma-K factor RskA
MEERIRQRAEEYLSGRLSGSVDPEIERLLASNNQDRVLLDQFAEQAAMIRNAFRVSAELAPSPGFYSRVMARVQAEESQTTFWSIFTGSFGQKLVYASAALLVLMSVAMFTTEDSSPTQDIAGAPAQILVDDHPDVHLVGEQSEDRGRVFVTLATSTEEFQ